MEGNETGSNEQVSRNSVLLRLVASPCSSKRVRPRIFRNFTSFPTISPSWFGYLSRETTSSLLFIEFSRFEDLVDRRIDARYYWRIICSIKQRSINFSTVYGGEEGWLFGLIRKEVASFGPGSSRRR